MLATILNEWRGYFLTHLVVALVFVARHMGEQSGTLEHALSGWEITLTCILAAMAFDWVWVRDRREDRLVQEEARIVAQADALMARVEDRSAA